MMRRLMILIAFGLFLAGVFIAGSARADETGSAKVEGAVSGSLWYDADEASVVPVTVKPVVDDSLNRESRWLPKAEKVAKPAVTPTTTPTSGKGGVFGSGLTFANLLGWFVLIAILVATIALVIFVMNKAEVDLAANPASRRRSGANGGATDEQLIERMKHLPAELRRTDVNLRSEAERLMGEGSFDQAIILLFGHQLLMLDHEGMLRLNRGKTNRKYIQETRAADPHAAQPLKETVDAFERSYFGRHSISATEFTEIWRSNEELESLVRISHGAAA